MAAIGVHLGCTSACVAVYKVRDSGSWVAGAASFGYEAKSFGLRGCERRVAGLGTSHGEAILRGSLGAKGWADSASSLRPLRKGSCGPSTSWVQEDPGTSCVPKAPSPGADPGTFWAPDAPGAGADPGTSWALEAPGVWGADPGTRWELEFPPRGWGRTRPRPGRWRPREGRRTWGPHGRRRPGGGPERLVPGGFWTFAKKEQGGGDLELDLLIPRSVGSQLMVCAPFTCSFWK